MLLKLTYVVVTSFVLFWHPFHVSVMDMEYDLESKNIQVSHRIFLDDLEDALKDFHGLEYIDTVEPKDAEELDRLISEYLKKKVFFVIDGEDKTFEYYGSELEGDARWCYYEVKDVTGMSKMELTNVALMDVFDDQQNILHIKAKGDIQSYKLDKNTKVKTFTF